MTKISDDYLAYILYEVFSGISGITHKRTIGGSLILYKDWVIFGLIADNSLYFKVDAVTKPKYEAMGASPFTYQNKDGDDVALSYYEVPDGVIENKELLKQWIEEAQQVSQRAQKK